MNVAVILAGGVGKRLGLSTPKQFFKVAGKMVVEHTIDTFEHNSKIDEIAIVSNAFYISEFETLILKNGWKKVKKILKGGKERYDSSLSAIYAYEGQKDVRLIFHDAVRPLVSQRIIDDVVEALDKYDAINVALPSADTIIEVDGDFISNIPDRSRLRRGQTPQAFRLETIRAAYDIALQDPEFKVTDDCGVVMKYLPTTPIFVVEGEGSNMKLTYKEDTYMMDKFFQLRQSGTEGLSLEGVSMEGKVAVVFGGSYGIGLETVRLLQQLGAKVYSFSRSQNSVDVGLRSQVAEALRSVADKEHRIDYVINTAGILNKEPLLSTSEEDIELALRTNYMGTVNVAIESHKYLRDTNGRLIFFTSSSYTRGRAFYSIYSSTKAAIVNFVQAIAQEWETDGICVNCINPERTKTPMRQHNFGIEPEDSLLSAQEVAEATVKVLTTNHTGQVFDVRRK
ncbi:MAG: bifunctional cytidylyltransferase/SDR family oxidoreductase [Prevotella sp.]|nr:bifunctional cytidylyltransferase/SDR family oxidoreductase [Prevotella sp.]